MRAPRPPLRPENAERTLTARAREAARGGASPAAADCAPNRGAGTVLPHFTAADTEARRRNLPGGARLAQAEQGTGSGQWALEPLRQGHAENGVPGGRPRQSAVGTTGPVRPQSRTARPRRPGRLPGGRTPAARAANRKRGPRPGAAVGAAAGGAPRAPDAPAAGSRAGPARPSSAAAGHTAEGAAPGLCGRTRSSAAVRGQGPGPRRPLRLGRAAPSREAGLRRDAHPCRPPPRSPGSEAQELLKLLG